MKCKITVGSFTIQAHNKEDLLKYIKEHWTEFYRKAYSSGRFSWDLLNRIDKEYFNPNFSMTKEEAKEKLYILDYNCINIEPYLHVKFLLNWYIKFGPNENPRQMTLEDFINEN